MVKVSIDQFINTAAKEVSKHQIIRLVIKRGDLYQVIPEIKKKLKRKQKLEIIEKFKQEQKISNNVLFKFDDGQHKTSAYITADEINKFTNQLSNIYRLHCLRQDHDLKKNQAPLPTQRNPKSKCALKILKTKQKNKERRIKKNQLDKLKKKQQQRLRTFAQKKKEQQDKELTQDQQLKQE